MVNAIRLREYIDAVVRVVTHVELESQCSDWDEFEYLEGTLIELLEQHRDRCKPELDARAHSRTK